MNNMTYFISRKNIRDSLSESERLNFDMGIAGVEKSPTVALILSLTLGTLGVDRFYLGQIGLGLTKLVTLGCLGIWTIIDWFLIMSSTRSKNIQLAHKLQKNINFTNPINPKKKYPWVFIIITIMFCLFIIGFISEKNETNDKSHLSSKKGYTLTPRESIMLKAVLEDEALSFSNGADTILKRELVSVSAVNAEIDYNKNQVAADQKYYGKMLYVTGQIASINSGLGNNPYIIFHGINTFMPPQAHFSKNAAAKIASLMKGQTINLVCVGDGSIAGTPMFKNCQFALSYAEKKITQIESDISDCLSGKKISSEIAKMLVLTTIASARVLPEESMCLTSTKGCLTDMKKIFKLALSKKNLKSTAEELKSFGIDINFVKEHGDQEYSL